MSAVCHHAAEQVCAEPHITDNKLHDDAPVVSGSVKTFTLPILFLPLEKARSTLAHEY